MKSLAKFVFSRTLFCALEGRREVAPERKRRKIALTVLPVGLISWLPFLLLIGVWFVLSRKVGMQARGKSGVTMIELHERQVEESRLMNANLERIAVAPEKP